MVYAVRHACRTHLQPLVVGAGRLVHGLLLPTNGALASSSHLPGTQRRSQDGAVRRSMGARGQGSIRVWQGPCVRAHGQGADARACWRALGGSARRAHDNKTTTSARVVVRHGKVRTEACSFASFSGSTGILGGGTRRGFCARRPHAVLGCGNSTSSKTRKPTSVGGLPKDDLSFVTRSVREERREGMDNLFGLRPDQQVCAAPLRAATLCDLCVCPTCACVATLCVPGE